MNYLPLITFRHLYYIILPSVASKNQESGKVLNRIPRSDQIHPY